MKARTIAPNPLRRWVPKALLILVQAPLAMALLYIAFLAALFLATPSVFDAVNAAFARLLLPVIAAFWALAIWAVGQWFALLAANLDRGTATGIGWIVPAFRTPWATQLNASYFYLRVPVFAAVLFGACSAVTTSQVVLDSDFGRRMVCTNTIGLLVTAMPVFYLGFGLTAHPRIAFFSALAPALTTQTQFSASEIDGFGREAFLKNPSLVFLTIPCLFVMFATQFLPTLVQILILPALSALIGVMSYVAADDLFDGGTEKVVTASSTRPALGSA